MDAPAISRAAGQVATVTFTRTTADLSLPLTVHYTVKGPLRNGEDYAALAGAKKIDQAGRDRATLAIIPLAGGSAGARIRVISKTSPLSNISTTRLYDRRCTQPEDSPLQDQLLTL